MAARITWLVAGEKVCPAYTSFSLARGEYVCTVLHDGRAIQRFSKDRDAAIGAARAYVEEAVGKIVAERLPARRGEVRVVRLSGAAGLKCNERVVQVDEEVPTHLAKMSSAARAIYLMRDVLPNLDTNGRELLTDWIESASWACVPGDALLLTHFHDADWTDD